MSKERQIRLDILLKCENNDDHAYSIREYVVHNLIVSIRINCGKEGGGEIISKIFDFCLLSFFS